MATQNALSESVAKLRECSICFEQMSLPKVLPCQHTFCLNCLTKTVDSIMKKIQCAICRKVHNLPNNGVKGFPNNLTLMTLIDSMKNSVGVKRKREEIAASRTISNPTTIKKYKCGFCRGGMYSNMI